MGETPKNIWRQEKRENESSYAKQSSIMFRTYVSESKVCIKKKGYPLSIVKYDNLVRASEKMISAWK